MVSSDKAVGVVLYQERRDEFGVVHERIGFASQNFSNSALRWDAFKKEESTVDSEVGCTDCSRVESVPSVFRNVR